MVDLQNCTVLLLVWLASIALFQTIWTKLQARAHLPPGPRTLPIIGNQHLLRPIAHQALHKLSLTYGPLMCLFFGSKPCVVVSSPEMAQEVLKTHETFFLNRPKMVNIDYLTYGSSDLTTAPYGPLWKFMKKICMSDLLNGQTVEQFRPIRQEEVNQFLQIEQILKVLLIKSCNPTQPAIDPVLCGPNSSGVRKYKQNFPNYCLSQEAPGFSRNEFQSPG